MDGNILGVDVQNNQVALKTPSGERYYFPISEWKGDFEPQAGMKVDFDIKDGVATNVFPLTNPVNKHQFKTIGDKPTKTKTAATLWAFFLGGLGAHKFYLGAWGWGAVTFTFLLDIHSNCYKYSRNSPICYFN